MSKSFFTLKPEKRQEIVKLFFQRVKSASRRSKILQLAATFGDVEKEDDAYFQTIYHYSLEENWSEIDDDYKEFVLPFGMSDEGGGSKRDRKKRK
jgi:hypothetical protein